MNESVEKLSGTLSELVKKAREVGAQAIETVDRNGTVRGVYARGAERTKAYARMARLNTELNREGEELRRIYTEIGRLYFEQARENAEGFFVPLFAQAETTAAKLRSIESELAALKEETFGESAEKDIEVEIGAFDEVVSADEKTAKDGE